MNEIRSIGFPIKADYIKENKRIEQIFEIKTDEFKICTPKIITQKKKNGLLKKENITYVLHLSSPNTFDFDWSILKIDGKKVSHSRK